MKTYVVTGGSGFIGSHLVDYLLANDNKVIILDNLSTGNINNLSEQAKEFLVYKDVSMCMPQELNRICENANGIFHMAAIPSVQQSIDDAIKTLNSNLISTIKMLEVAKKHSIKFVYSSSSAVYGNIYSSPISEHHAVSPISPYALNKYQGEEYCKLYSEIYDVDTVILRYFNVYGSRMNNVGAYRSVLSVFLDSYKKKQSFNIVNDGKQRRDFVHVSDVINANILSMNNSVTIQIPINIGAGKNYSINEIADLFGAEKHYGEKRIEPNQTLANIGRANLLLKWKPLVSLEEWIKEQL